MISSTMPAIRRKEMAPRIPPMSADGSVGSGGAVSTNCVKSEAKTLNYIQLKKQEHNYA